MTGWRNDPVHRHRKRWSDGSPARTKRMRRSLVTAGAMLADTPAWLGEVAGLVADGSISVGVAAAIRKGLGDAE